MSDTKYSLPEYPVVEDMWDRLARETRPIVVYGMGNGADKLFSRLCALGVTVADVFASDGFVRGHSFRGYRVNSFSEIKEKYSDFVILLSFASNRSEVLELLTDIDKNYDMYIPDMPVAGEEYFDREYYNAHYAEIKDAFNALADEDSRRIFSSVVRYKLSGKMECLIEGSSTSDDIFSLLPTDKIYEMADLGAYNGDTVREAISRFPSLARVTALEPDPKNFKRLLRYAEGEERIDLRCVNAAAWSGSSVGEFISSGNRNSSVSSTASYKHKDTEIPLVALDCLEINPDYIKYDVEGAEREALIGSLATIRRANSSLLVSVYHRSADIFEITNMLRHELSEYDMYMRRPMCVPAWELDLILVKKGR